MEIESNILNLNNDKNIPLCVDLDGTIIYSDTLIESLFTLIKQKPYFIFILPFWILKGKTIFKNKVKKYIIPNPASLPYRNDVVDFLKSEKAKGRKIVLATATVQEIADSIQNHLQIFDEVLGSSESVNLRSSNKRAKLVELYGEKGFDYIGDSSADFEVWKSTRNALVVNNSNIFVEKVKKIANVDKVFKENNSFIKLLFKQIRVYQWVKNILIFLPLLMAHKISDLNSLITVLFAFITFSLGASFVYVLNDLLDLESDRQHPRKRNRPLASGKFSLKTAVITAPLLLILSLTITILFLNVEFLIVQIVYLIITCLYSFYLKRLHLLDIMTLAMLYTLRIIAGGMAVKVPLSPWLLAFSVFLFFSLAIVKRYTELRVMKAENKQKTSGRGYFVEDMELILNLGTVSGMLSVLIFVLYVNSHEVVQLYKNPEYLWPVSLILLYWISRIWFKAHRDEMNDDPIVFTVKDPVSYIIGLIVLLLVIGAAI